MTQAINQVGHAVGLKTIAEFVENDGILEQLRNLGVDYAQGYGIAKPRPLVMPQLNQEELILCSSSEDKLSNLQYMS